MNFFTHTRVVQKKFLLNLLVILIGCAPLPMVPAQVIVQAATKVPPAVYYETALSLLQLLIFTTDLVISHKQPPLKPDDPQRASVQPLRRIEEKTAGQQTIRFAKDAILVSRFIPTPCTPQPPAPHEPLYKHVEAPPLHLNPESAVPLSAPSLETPPNSAFQIPSGYHIPTLSPQDKVSIPNIFTPEYCLPEYLPTPSQPQKPDSNPLFSCTTSAQVTNGSLSTVTLIGPYDQEALSIKHLAQQQAARRLAAEKIVQRKIRTEFIANERLLLQDLCTNNPSIAAHVQQEITTLERIFSACLQQSKSPEIIVQQIALASFPHNFEYCENFIGLSSVFQKTVNDLQALLFLPDGTFKGVQSYQDQCAAATIFARYLEKVTPDHAQYCALLQHGVAAGLPGFEELLTQAQHPFYKVLSLPTVSLHFKESPEILAQAIACNTFTNDLQKALQLTLSDPCDFTGGLTQAHELMLPYSATQGVSDNSPLKEKIASRIRILECTINPAYSKMYTAHGIRHCFTHDPLVPELVENIASATITAQEANTILAVRNATRELFYERIGITQAQASPFIQDIVQTLVDYGNNPEAAKTYLQTKLCNVPLTEDVRWARMLFLNDYGQPCIPGYIIPEKSGGCSFPVAEPLEQLKGFDALSPNDPVLAQLPPQIPLPQEKAFLHKIQKFLINNPAVALQCCYAANKTYNALANRLVLAMDSFDPKKNLPTIPEGFDLAPSEEELLEAPTKPCTVEDILAEATPGEKTRGKSTIYNKPGTFEDAVKDFYRLNPSNIKFYGKDMIIGDLNDGRRIIVRNYSSGNLPTLEIQTFTETGINYEKLRYLQIRY